MEENIKKVEVQEQNSFQFIGYTVTDASIKMSGEDPASSMSLQVYPYGEFNEDKKQFILILRAEVSDAKKSLEVSLLIKGIFQYNTKDAQFLRDLCLRNAPAILFPYIRAYVSNITSLGGIQPIIIPTYLFTGVGDALLESLGGRFPNLGEATETAPEEAPKEED